MSEEGNNANSNTEDEVIYWRLQLAAMKGDWKSALPYLSQNISCQITGKKETALHIAAIAERVDFVKNLVEGQNVEYLLTKNHRGLTALTYAATTGNVKIAKLMIEKLKLRQDSQHNPPANILSEQLVQPLIIAAKFGHREMVKYLLSQCEVHEWSVDNQFNLFVGCIETSLYDVAVRLLQGNTNLAYHRDRNNETALHVLACKPSARDSESKLGMWMKYINPYKKEIHNLAKDLCEHAFIQNLRAASVSSAASSSASSSSSIASDVENQNPATEILSFLFAAAEVGNLEVLIELIHFNLDLMWTVDNDRGTIFHIAVRQRHESIFGLLSELGSTKYLIAQCVIEGTGNNILHLAAESAPQDKVNVVSGAALQMQRAILWFTEVEKIVPHSSKHKKNSSGMTPQALFEKTHENLRIEAEKWMKETAESSTVVAALIATVMFGVTFNVPGGFDNPSGKPNLLEEKLFLVFYIADALSLFWSSTSALMFLSILTSRYAYRDFLWILPFKLMIGITLLFISMAAMMAAFCATFLLYYPNILGSTTLMLTVFGVYAFVPILYFSLKYSLLIDLIRAIFSPRSLFQPPKCLLY